MTGPVHIEGAEPGDILEVEILDVSPLVDFGYTTVSPALGLFGSLRPEGLAQFAPWMEAAELSDPAGGRVPSAIPEDQPFNAGASYVQLFEFDKGQSSGFATFVGTDTGRRARIPVAPFMGIMGTAPMRKGMYRSFPSSFSGGMGGNIDIKQITKGSVLQLPVYVEGAKFSAGDGHMAQGDGEISRHRDRDADVGDLPVQRHQEHRDRGSAGHGACLRPHAAGAVGGDDRAGLLRSPPAADRT